MDLRPKTRLLRSRGSMTSPCQTRLRRTVGTGYAVMRSRIWLRTDSVHVTSNTLPTMRPWTRLLRSRRSMTWGRPLARWNSATPRRHERLAMGHSRVQFANRSTSSTVSTSPPSGAHYGVPRANGAAQPSLARGTPWCGSAGAEFGSDRS